MNSGQLGDRQPTGAAEGMQDVEALVPLAASVARRALHRPTPVFDYDDAVATGLIGLVEARNRHDPSRGNNFPAYACCRVRGAVLDAIRALDYLPQGARKRLALAARRRNGEKPHGQSRLWDKGLPPPPVSMSRLVRRAEEGAGVLPDVPDDDPFLNPEWFADRSETLRELEGALLALPPRERAVVCLRYWEHRTLADVGHRFGVSTSRVRQIEKQALGRLRRYLENGDDSL